MTQQQSAAKLVQSRYWSRLTSMDLMAADDIAATRIRLLLIAPWMHLRRASRALAIFDSEIRRFGAAYLTVHQTLEGLGKDDLFDLFEEDDDGRPTRAGLLRTQLSGYPAPAGAGELRIAFAGLEPLTVLLEPEGALAESLSDHPASSLAYAMSAFGQYMDLTSHVCAELEGARYASEGETARVLSDVVRGIWAGSDPGRLTEERGLPGRPTNFRAVSPESRSVCTGPFTSLAAVLFVAASIPGKSSLTKITLHETTTVALEEARTPHEARGETVELPAASLDLLP